MAPGREMKARSGEKEGLVTHPKGLSDVSATIPKTVTTEDALQTDNDNSTETNCGAEDQSGPDTNVLMAPLPKPRRHFFYKNIIQNQPKRKRQIQIYRYIETLSL